MKQASFIQSDYPLMVCPTAVIIIGSNFLIKNSAKNFPQNIGLKQPRVTLKPLWIALKRLRTWFFQERALMIPVAEARKLLGTYGSNKTDVEIEMIVKFIYKLCERVVLDFG